MLNVIEKIWIEVKIAFDVRDPLRMTGRQFEPLPSEQLHELGPAERRRLTICNLFANQEQTVDQIAIYFETTRTEVVSVLIAEGLIREQRQRPPMAIKNGRRELDKKKILQ
jgi:hypothetical protein